MALLLVRRANTNNGKKIKDGRLTNVSSLLGTG
jgi:hypothetical protein